MSTESELTAQLKKGLQYQQEGKPTQALECYDAVLTVVPRQLDASYFKSIILLQSGHLEETIQLLQPLLEQEPVDSLHEAIARCHRVVGSAQQQLGNLPQAIQHFEKASALHPEELDYAADCIQALLADQQLDAASERANNLPPEAEQHLRCLAARAEVHWQSWQVADCLQYLQRAMRLAPTQLDLVSQYLFALNYLEPDDPEVASLHIALGAALERHYRAGFHQDPPNPKAQAKALRIGFISPDLRNHSVSFFLLPLLKALSANPDVWVAAYALNQATDATTESIAKNCDHWVHMPSSRDLSAVAADDLDILFDLAGHTSGNCLPLLLTSPKPAPMIVNWLGYPNTTGFQYHNFRFVDTITDPPLPEHKETTSEQRVFLEPSFLCYSPPGDCPEINASPAATNDLITAGCLNNLNKITQTTLNCWAALLLKVPHLRILLKSPAFASQSVKQRLLRVFDANDVDPSRITLLERSPDTQSHLSTYHQIDFTLDTFPYNGTTTTFESLYMGCPVITMKGQCHRSRVSSSILTHLGHPEWIASNPESYIDRAADLASSPAFLLEIRRSLRAELLESPLCDTEKFAESFLKTCHMCKKTVNSR